LALVAAVSNRRAPDGVEQAAGELNMRMYFPEELDALLKYNGLPVERKWGDVDGSPFGPSSTQQIPVCGAHRAKPGN
jgi:hypothetical protein